MDSRKDVTEVHFFGSLAIAQSGNPAHHLQFDVPRPVPLREFLNHIQIAFDKVQLAMVNHRAVTPDYVIHPGDRVALFPREYPIYPDWEAFRS